MYFTNVHLKTPSSSNPGTITGLSQPNTVYFAHFVIPLVTLPDQKQLIYENK